MSNVRGVTVVNDFVRADKDGHPGEGDRSAVWLFDAVKRQVQAAARLPIHLLTARNCPDLYAWVQQKRPPKEADAFWAAVYDHLPIDAALEAILLPRLQGQFVIGYEMPAYLLGLLAQRGVPYIDIRIHPIRFLDDLIFATRASDTATQHALMRIAVSEETVIAQAGLVEAMCRYTANCSLPSNTLLVIGQRTFDSSQIIAGKFFDALESRSHILGICETYKTLLLKPHPYEGKHSLLMLTSAAPNTLGVTSDNVYRLFAQPEIAGILTVNSSAAYEARYFGKQVHTLGPLSIRLAWRGDAAFADSYLSVDQYLLSVDFWRLILGPHTHVSPPTGVTLPPKPNRLRIAHDTFWNFQEIDTDRIPHR